MSAVNTIWTLLGASLVFFMQAGFAMVESGFTRAKNAGNIVMKNLMDLCIGTPLFWFLGFGIMFGSASPVFGGFDFFIRGDYSSILPNGVPLMAYVIFQTVFCATSATIVSGAMAERTKFVAYCIYSAVISLLIYPISGHWIWGGGWLGQLGFHDFAGSTAVHLVGGTAAFIGAWMLGPRIGKYSKHGKSRAIPGHNIAIGALGVMILWFGWFGFNGCSTVSMEGNAIELASNIFMNTNMSAATAACTVMIVTWFRYKKPDVSMTLNGVLAGLVAITAGCDEVTVTGAAIIGICSGITVIFSVEFIDKILKVDDPVGAVSVHGVCGALGTVLLGLFSKEEGLFYTGTWHFFLIQLVGVFSVILWVAVTMFIAFKLVNVTVGLRVSEQEEIEGLDKTEHGLISAYADFLAAPDMINYSSLKPIDTVENNFMEIDATTDLSEDNLKEFDSRFSKVEIICKQNKFEELKSAMNDINVTGMTVTQVLGCGMQKGSTEYYRGSELEMQLLPKVKVEIVLAKVPVKKVVETARKVLYTGHIGDGKIFVYRIAEVIKVRTGETGYGALQGVDDL